MYVCTELENLRLSVKTLKDVNSILVNVYGLKSVFRDKRLKSYLS